MTQTLASLDKSQISVQAALAAGDQGKFWEMRDLLHSKYDDWATLTTNQFNSWIKSQTVSLGLDGIKFVADYQSSETAERTKSMNYEAAKIPILGIPEVFINGGITTGQPSRLQQRERRGKFDCVERKTIHFMSRFRD